MANATAWHGVGSTMKYGVHLGIWTNWSRGAIMGATLTLRRIEGNYLLAFTSLFITIVSGCFWTIARRLLHCFYSTSAPRDTIHHQQQAVFRNSSSAFESFQILCSLAWAWRHTVKAKRGLLRLVPGSLAAAFVVVAFGIASGFSSQISSAIGTQVLVDGKDCSLYNAQADDPDFDSYTSSPYRAGLVSNFANYAQQCYSNTSSSGVFDCTRFVKPRLPSTVDTQAPCPFANGLCRSNTANIRLDTGYIDSHKDLGMNAPENERILFRSVLSCAPLSTAGFSTNVTRETGNYTIYDYGNKTMGYNYTYMVRSVQDQYPADDVEGGRGSTFVLTPFSESSFNGSIYMPMSSIQSDLFPRDGDLDIIFLSGNNIRFMAPVLDPWYRATTPSRPFSRAGEPGTPEYPSYQFDEAASPLACLQQYQFCDASTNLCGSLGSWPDSQTTAGELFGTTLDPADPPAENDPAASSFFWFVALLTYSVPSLTILLLHQGANSLASTRSLYSGVIGPLPSNQWQIDVTQWWATYLAGIQDAVVSSAIGLSDPSLSHRLIKPYNNWIQDHICNNQIVQSADYTSFSLFGLYFTYICGLLIIVVAFSLDPLSDYLSKRFQRGAYSYLEWASTETLQLQRMAFQGVKSGKWSGSAKSADSIPITSQAGEIMANLPFEYPIGHAGREKRGSSVAHKPAAGLPVRMVPTKTNTSTEYTDYQKESPKVTIASPTTMEISPVSTTVPDATSTQAKRPA